MGRNRKTGMMGGGKKKAEMGGLRGKKKKIERWWEVVARRTFDYL